MTATRISTFTIEGPTIDLFVSDCTCGVIFAMPRDLEKRRRADGKPFWCPNGHELVFTETDRDRLEKAKVRETALRDQLDASIREAEQVRQALLRDRQRFANGVCPCCNRSFENVRRHMASQHPDYDVKAIAKPMRFACSCGRDFETLRGLRTHQGWQRPQNWTSPNLPDWRRHLTAGVAR